MSQTPPNSFFGKNLTFRHFLTSGKRYWGVLLAMVVITLVGSFWALIYQKPTIHAANDQNFARPPWASLAIVETKQLIYETAPRLPREFTGALRATRTSELGFKRTGQLVKVLVGQGDVVTEREVLAELDTDSLRASLAEVQAQRQSAVALLDELVAGPRPQTIAVARAETNDLKAQWELAQLDFERRQRLRKAGSISEQEYDDAKSNLASVAERLRAAQMRLAELEEGTRAERVRGQQAEVARLDAVIEKINVDLQESQLVAPFEAIVSQRLFDEGSIVNIGQPIFRLVENGQLEAWIGLPPEIAANLLLDEYYPLKLDQHRFDGKLKAILPELDPITRTRTARFMVQARLSQPLVSDQLSLPEPPQPGAGFVPLAPGQMVRLILEQEVNQSGYWVPTKALTRGQRGLWSLYIAKPISQTAATTQRHYPGEKPFAQRGKREQPEEGSGLMYILERRDVEILQIDSERVLIQGELDHRQHVVTSGLHRLTPGQLVRVVE